MGAVPDDEAKENVPEVLHGQPQRVIVCLALRGLVEPEVKELGKMIVPVLNGKAMLPVLREPVDNVLAPVNDRGRFVLGRLMVTVAPVVRPDVQSVQPAVDVLC